MPSDQEIIAAVDAIARQYTIAAEGKDPGLRVYTHRWRWARAHWERAAKDYKEQTGLDVREAMARHEAWLRSPENAPQLYVDKR